MDNCQIKINDIFISYMYIRPGTLDQTSVLCFSTIRFPDSRNLSTDLYHIGYRKDSASGSSITTHNGAPQSWTYWSSNEPDNIDDTCIAIRKPYGLWEDIDCTVAILSICSSVSKGE